MFNFSLDILCGDEAAIDWVIHQVIVLRYISFFCSALQQRFFGFSGVPEVLAIFVHIGTFLAFAKDEQDCDRYSSCFA